MSRSKIFIIGMPGAGKSYSIRNVKNSIDTDKLIQVYTKKSIEDIFQRFGEKYFRKKEAQILRKVVKSPKYKIIATGGGTPLFYNNLKLMKKYGTVVFLNIPVKQIMKNICSSKSKRPLIKNKKKNIYKLYRERIPYYKKADIILNSSKELKNYIYL